MIRLLFILFLSNLVFTQTNNLTCWGSSEESSVPPNYLWGDEYGQVGETPDGIYTSVSVGLYHTCAIGLVVCLSLKVAKDTG